MRVVYKHTSSVFTREPVAGATRFVFCGFLDPEAIAAERVSNRGVKKVRKKKNPRPHSVRAQCMSGTWYSLLGLKLLKWN